MGLSEKTKAWLKDNCSVSLRGKTALITGADSGVGFQTAEILLQLDARSKLFLAIYTRELARRKRETRLRILMSHPGITMTPLGMNAYGKTVSRLAGRLRGVFNSPEKSALSAAYILSHEVPNGALVGPDRFFGGWGFPRENKIPRRADRNAEELIRFTEKEIARAGGQIP